MAMQMKEGTKYLEVSSGLEVTYAQWISRDNEGGQGQTLTAELTYPDGAVEIPLGELRRRIKSGEFTPV